MPEQAARVTWAVGDLMRLGDDDDDDDAPAGGGNARAAADTVRDHYRRLMRARFHLVTCFGVLHHCR